MSANKENRNPQLPHNDPLSTFGGKSQIEIIKSTLLKEKEKEKQVDKLELPFPTSLSRKPLIKTKSAIGLPNFSKSLESAKCLQRQLNPVVDYFSSFLHSSCGAEEKKIESQLPLNNADPLVFSKPQPHKKLSFMWFLKKLEKEGIKEEQSEKMPLVADFNDEKIKNGSVSNKKDFSASVPDERSSLSSSSLSPSLSLCLLSSTPLDLPLKKFLSLFPSDNDDFFPSSLHDSLLQSETPFVLYVLHLFQKPKDFPISDSDKSSNCLTSSFSFPLFHLPYLKSGMSLFQSPIFPLFHTVRDYISVLAQKLCSFRPLSSDEKEGNPNRHSISLAPYFSVPTYFVGTKKNEEDIEAQLVAPRKAKGREGPTKTEIVPSGRPLIRFVPEHGGVYPFERETNEPQKGPCFSLRSMFFFDSYQVTNANQRLRVAGWVRSKEGLMVPRGFIFNERHFYDLRSYRQMAMQLLGDKFQNKIHFYVGKAWLNERTGQLWAQIGIHRKEYIFWSSSLEKFVISIHGKSVTASNLPSLMTSLCDRQGVLAHRAFRRWGT